MYKILKKQILCEQITKMDIYAPHVARKAEAGQFIMLRIKEGGERIPLTIADYKRDEGTITVVFQSIGKTTMLLSQQNEGDFILDLAGPLGTPTHLDGYKKVAVIGGGLGVAIAYPQAKKLFGMGARVDIIAGFRNKDIIIMENELKAVCDNLYITTDDGSNGNKGFVTDMLRSLIEKGNDYDLVVAIGPLIMMKFISKLTKEFGIKTLVSLNPVMIDGTGMCGGCRVTVNNEVKFACVDGPDFDGHLVDFDEAIRRQQMYKEQEKKSVELHNCRLGGAIRE